MYYSTETHCSVSMPKSAAAKPKSAVNTKGGAKGPNTNIAKPNGAAANTGRGGRQGGRGGRGGRKGNARPRKTAEELDADMVDYFVDNNGTGNAAGNTTAAAPNGGEAAMEDEIM